jgi:predicted methyltransferase
MKSITSLLLVLTTCAACGSSSPPPPAEPPPAPAPAQPPLSAGLEPAPVSPPAPAAPDPEAAKKAEEAQKLAADRTKVESESAAERARFTPELRDQTSAIAARKYPSLRAALAVVLKSPHRKPGNPDRDAARHPLQTLEFFGLKPTMSVLEYGPGEGWFTELLAPVLATQGKLYITSVDPNGPKDVRSTMYAERTKAFLEKAPELYGKVETVIYDDKNPDLKLESQVDMVLVMRGMHGWVRNDRTSHWLAEIHQALKPNGILGIEQHRGKADANPAEAPKTGYLPEAWVIQQVEAAGFKLAAKSEINANPKDTKDHPEGVWALAPTFRLGDKDREKYAAIGESDRMTLRFVKRAAPAATKPGALPARKSGEKS